MVPGQTECPWATRDGWGVATLFAPHPGVLCDLGGAAPLWRPGWVCRDPEVWGCRPGALLPAPSPPDRGLSVLGPRGLAGASRSGSPRGPHSHSCPSQLRTTAAGPRLCRGVNGALAGRGPTSARRGPERSDRQCAGLVASQASASRLASNTTLLTQPLRVARGPRAWSASPTTGHSLLPLCSQACRRTGGRMCERAAPGQAEARGRVGAACSRGGGREPVQRALEAVRCPRLLGEAESPGWARAPGRYQSQF